MKIRLLESARADLRRGYHFYERQTQGLGAFFLDAVQADVRSLTIYAGIHPKVEGLHRLLVKRFPYAIYYDLQHDRADIYAILDCRQNPEQLMARLEGLK